MIQRYILSALISINNIPGVETDMIRRISNGSLESFNNNAKI